MKFFVLALTLVFSSLAMASDMDEIQQCLHNWKHHPFSKTPEFRTISAKVKVMGIGGQLTDETKTAKPELVLLKPAVNVMSKNVISLMNPNGWYCLKGKVDVLGKTEINLACKAHMATSTDSATVLGSNKDDAGVTVLGKSVIKRMGCPDGEGAKQVE